MTPDTQRLWNETLEEFRALGGIAENVCLAEGRFGRGLFPIDPLKPVRLHVPESLLIDVAHLHFQGHELSVGPESPAGARAKAFYEKYQRDFSWGVGRQFTEDLLNQFQMASPELRALLVTPFALNRWFVKPSPRSISQLYFASRAIHYRNRDVSMPVLEIANHGNGRKFETENGIGLSGVFEGEILVRYDTILDSLEVFDTWGFAAPEDAALSLGLSLDKAGIIIERDTTKSPSAPVPFFPHVSARDEKVVLSHLLLGHKQYPRLAKGIFYKIMRDAGRKDPEALFDAIQHANRIQFYRLQELLDGASPELCQLLRRVASFQLEAMSNSIGAREI